MTKSEAMSGYNMGCEQEVREKHVTAYVYIDVLFFINFLMDFLILLIMRKVMNLKSTKLKITAAAAAGSVWACAISLWPVVPWWAERLFTMMCVSGLMIQIAFSLKGLIRILKAVGAMNLTAAALCGIFYALDTQINAGYYLGELVSGNFSHAISAVPWLFFALGAYFAVKYLMLLLGETRRERNHYYHVTLHHEGKEITVTALLDTGNHLREPVTRRPVHVLTGEAGKMICGKVSSVIYIPFQAVGTKGGILPGIFMDFMDIERDGAVTRVEKPLIAIATEPLSPNGSYQMLLNEDLQEGKEQGGNLL